MSLSINIVSLNPDSVSLGEKTVVSVEYRVGANPEKEVDVSFTSRGGFTISGNATFSHTVESPKSFTKQIIVTGTSPDSENTLTATVSATGENDEEDTATLGVSGSEAMALLDRESVTVSAFLDLEETSLKRGFVYRLLKENGFHYNPKTKQWHKN